MDRKYRFVLYFLLCLSILTFPYIAEICIDVWVWLSKTIDTNCLIVSLCIAGIFLFMEFQIHTCKKDKKNNADKYKTTVSALYYDSPSSNDIFNRRSYAKLLLDKIYSSFYSNNCQEQIARHSFVIHIGEHYGQGKTSFLMMLEEEIKEEIPVVYIKFEPWLCDTELGIIQEFFSTFREYVGKYLPKIENTVKEYIFLLLSSIGYSNSGFSLNLQNVVKNSNRTLKETHDKIRDELQKIDRPVIITIDDVDRLQSKELMMVLKLIRDTADFPNVFYIIVADNIHLKKMLNIQHIDDAETYLEKFFNLEFQLPANENVAFNELLNLITDKYKALQIENADDYIKQITNVPYIKNVFPNLRDVYRFVNIYFLAIDSISDATKLNMFDLFLLNIIQMQNLEFYMQLRDNSLNIFNVIKSGNDIKLVWRDDLNIVEQHNRKEIFKRLERIKAEDGEKREQKEEEEKQKRILDFTEIEECTKITSDKIVPEIMNILFGDSSNRVVEENRISRYNMYFRYFANTEASYMVSRMEVVAMLNSEENAYRKDLDNIFKQKRDEMFLSEYTNAVPYACGINDTTILKRFFIFIELSYKYKRDVTMHELLHSLADYEGYENTKHKLFQILYYVYGNATLKWKDEKAKQKRDMFLEFCHKYYDINILLVCVNVISRQLDAFIFDRNCIKQANAILVDRFYKEFIADSNGYISVQEADTIIQIKCEVDAHNRWNELFEKYLASNKEACLNILCKLVQFYTEGIEWNYNFHKALLDEYQLRENNILSRLVDSFPDMKDILNNLLFLHNNNSNTLTHVSDLEDNAFIIMAKERQSKTS